MPCILRRIRFGPTSADAGTGGVRSQGKGIRKGDQAVFEIRWGHFYDIELPDGLTLVVTEKRIRRSQSGAEGRADFRRVGADDGQLTIVDLEVLL
jgi:hypothetical protein